MHHLATLQRVTLRMLAIPSSPMPKDPKDVTPQYPGISGPPTHARGERRKGERGIRTEAAGAADTSAPLASLHRERYLSHQSSCPLTSRWRKEGGGEAVSNGICLQNWEVKQARREQVRSPLRNLCALALQSA